MAIEIAIDMGSSNTAIYLSGNGVVLYEATLAAFVEAGKSKKLLAVGNKAKLILGKAPERTSIVAPVVSGVIADKEAAIIFLRQMLKKITEQFLFPRRIRAVVMVPCGLNLLERRDFEDVCYSAGITELFTVDSTIAAAAGCDMPVDTHNCGLVANIGYGTTDIAAVSMCGIINGCSVVLGGKDMDVNICESLAQNYNMSVGMQTAEKIKEEIGSLLHQDISAMQVSGLDISSKRPVSYEIASNDIYSAVLPVYHRIGEEIRRVLDSCEPEVAAVITRTGITFSGGAAQIPGIEQLLLPMLKIPVTIAPEPKYAVIKGGGKLINDPVFLQNVLAQN